MKRRVTITLAFALIGMTLTVLVAWVCDTFAGESLEIHYDRPSDPLLMPGLYEPPKGWDVRTWVEFDGFGVGGVWISEMPWMGSTIGMVEESQNRIRIRYFSGWPMLCLQRSPPGLAPVPNNNDSAWVTGFDPPWSLSTPSGYRGQRLSIRPMPIRFTANTLFWAAASWLIILGPGRCKRWNRKRLSKCIACGYEIADLATCPECGSKAETAAGA